MYERVLVPTDGSVGTAHVALQAIDLAEQYDATVHVLHVVDRFAASIAGEEQATDLREQGERAVDRVAQMAGAHGVETVTAVEEGDPAETILEYANREAIDLVVMGTHGRTGLKRRLIGSVAEQVVRHAQRPVMTVRLPESDVTVQDADTATDIARGALADEGIDASVVATDRQPSVWVVEAERESTGASYLVYVDPVTQRTSVVDRS